MASPTYHKSSRVSSVVFGSALEAAQPLPPPQPGPGRSAGVERHHAGAPERDEGTPRQPRRACRPAPGRLIRRLGPEPGAKALQQGRQVTVAQLAELERGSLHAQQRSVSPAVWNQCASNLTGFSGAQVMGKHLVNEFITLEYKTLVADVLRNAMLGVETANFEFPLMNAAG